MFSVSADTEWDFRPDGIKLRANVHVIKEPVIKHNLCRIWLITFCFFFAVPLTLAIEGDRKYELKKKETSNCPYMDN